MSDAVNPTIRVGGMAFGNGVLMRGPNYWAWATEDKEVAYARVRTRNRGKAGSHDMTVPRTKPRLGRAFQTISTTTSSFGASCLVVGQKIPPSG